jgi:osmotically-inducible protein OsmY
MKKTFATTAASFVLAASLALGACAQSPTRESTGAYVDDAAITGKVKTAFLQDPALKVMQIEVTTYKNVVQLSGFVDSPQAVDRAGSVASHVGGVASVRNDLIVK